MTPHVQLIFDSYTHTIHRSDATLHQMLFAEALVSGISMVVSVSWYMPEDETTVNAEEARCSAWHTVHSKRRLCTCWCHSPVQRPSQGVIALSCLSAALQCSAGWHDGVSGFALYCTRPCLVVVSRELNERRITLGHLRLRWEDQQCMPCGGRVASNQMSVLKVDSECVVIARMG